MLRIVQADLFIRLCRVHKIVSSADSQLWLRFQRYVYFKFEISFTLNSSCHISYVIDSYNTLHASQAPAGVILDTSDESDTD